MRHCLSTPFARQFLACMLGASLIASLPTFAANVALATSPLANSSASVVTPNVMLMLDDSGSMDWDYMPDNAKNFAGKYGYNSSQCNGVYYDPDTTYTPPVKSDGTSYPNATFTAAWKDGYDTALGTTNLSTGFTGGSGGGASGINLTPGPAFYYKYNGTLTSSANQDFFNTSSPFYLECNTGSVPTSTGNTTFTKVTVTSTSAEAQNFANWYSYYSTRMMMMKTGVGEAFKTLNNRFRIGYMSMNNNNGTDIADIAAFTGGCTVNSLTCQKDKWYNKLYAANPGQSTPLRRALSQVGQLYANKYVPFTTYVATITITGGGSGSGGSITSITVPGGGTELMAAASAASTTTSTIAKNVASQINSITTSPYDAVASSNKVTITGPSSAVGILPSILTSGGMTFTQTAFTATTTAAQKLNGITPADPIQYSCQKNFVILSTDGYWNGAAGYKLDGTAIGNQDGTANRPMYDGSVIMKSTSQVKRTTTKTAQATSQLQQAQMRTSQLQQSTSSLQSSSYPLVSTVTPLNMTTYPLTSTTAPLIATTYPLISSTTPLNATSYPLISSSYALTSTQTPLIKTSTALQQQAWTLQKSSTPFTTWTNTASCTYTNTTHCQYVAGALTTVTSCTVSAKTTSTANNTAYNAAAVTCGYAATSTVTNPATSCTVVTQSAGPTNYTGPAVSCSYGTAVSTPNVTSCTLSAQTTSTANGTVYNANATSACTYATTPTVNNAASSCTVVTQTGPNFAGPAVSCSYGTGVVTTNVASCTTSAQTTSTANGTMYNATPKTCAYSTTPTVNSAATSCTIATASTASPYSGPAVSCSYGAGIPTSGAASCTVSAQTTGTTSGTVYNPTPKTCAYSTTPTVNNAATSCTVVTASAGPTYSGPNSVSCSYGTGVVTSNVSTCTTSAKTTSTTNGTVYNANPVTCAYSTTPTTNIGVGSCTVATVSTASPYSGPAVACSYGGAVVSSGVASCTTSPKTTATTNGTVYNSAAITCAYSAPVVTNVNSCTPIAASTASPYAGPTSVGCAYTAWPAWTNVNPGTCTDVPQDTATFNMTATNGVATQCQSPGVASCASGTTCNTVATGGSTNYVASCTAAATPTASNNYTVTTCTSTPVETNVFAPSCTVGAIDSTSPFAKTTACTPVTTGPTAVSSCIGETPTSANSYMTVTCSGGTGGTSDTLADTAMYYYQTDLRDPSLSNCTGILGAGIDVCENNVRTSGGDDNNEKQHMTTLTLGLGARGKMAFSPTYLADTPTTNSIRDFYDVKMGTSAATGICSWQTSGACNWPDPAGGGGPTAIDDLWHAAVDGRGTYFSATDPKSLAVGLSTALKSIDQKTGAAAAAATSTLNPVANNNFAYVASYTTVKWSGNLEQRDINTSTGVVSSDAGWCVENISQSTCIAPRQIVQETVGNATSYYCSSPATDVRAPVGIDALDCTAPDVLTTVGTTQVCRTQIHNTCMGTMPALVAADSDTRKIYTKANGTLVEFKPSDSAFMGAYSSYFTSSYIAGLSQWPAIVTAGKQTTAAGSNLINYLRGQYGYEENRTIPSHTTDDWLYRFRENTFGDALESQPTYIGAPTFNYLDPGYAAFATSHANRAGTVFIGANDGMMHAFNAVNGVERWAYVPSMVIPNMYKLADTSYDVKHVNFVNGSATISDVCTSACDSSSAVWKTILVGGLNAGGRGYYALDVTDPNNPVFMWEFSAADDPNLGYSYGRPVITKKQDGTWVVLVTSGYDNGTTAPDGTSYPTTPSNLAGDGGGYLYVLNAATGSRSTGGGAVIPTGVANTTTPSGLGKFEAYSDVTDSNQAGFVYGGDLEGNLWRFNINQPASTTATPPNPFKLAKLMAGTTPQPITVEPTLGKINGQRVIFVGTGQYLQPSDLSNTLQQTLYAIKDDQNGATVATLTDPRSSSSMVHQNMTQSGSIRLNSTPVAVDWATKRGWYVDFIDGKERVNIAAKLVQGTLIVPTIVPADSVCTPGGYGWLNFFDYEYGSPIDFANSIVGTRTDSTIVGVNIIYINQRPIVQFVSSSDPTPVIPPPKGGGTETTACTGAGCATYSGAPGGGDAGGSNVCPAGSACTWCGEVVCPPDPAYQPGSFMNQREMWREL